MNKIIIPLILLVSLSILAIRPLYSGAVMTSSVISSGGVMNSSSSNVTFSGTLAEAVVGTGVNVPEVTDLLSGFWYTTSSCCSSDIDGEEILPFKNDLSQNYPNPFNPSTTINYELQKDNIVTLSIYNVRGKLVENVMKDKAIQQGKHTVTFNGERLSSGYYFYKITVGINGQDFTKIKKMIMVK